MPKYSEFTLWQVLSKFLVDRDLRTRTVVLVAVLHPDTAACLVQARPRETRLALVLPSLPLPVVRMKSSGTRVAHDAPDDTRRYHIVPRTCPRLAWDARQTTSAILQASLVVLAAFLGQPVFFHVLGL